MPASEYRAAHQQVRELQRLLGKKTLENEILREALERVTAPKKLPLRVPSPPRDEAVNAIAAPWACRARTSRPGRGPPRVVAVGRLCLMLRFSPRSRR